MVTRALLLCFLLCLTSFSLFADEAKIDWSFVDIEYMELNFDVVRSDLTVEGNTSYELEGQFELGKNLLIYGAHQVISTDFTYEFGLIPGADIVNKVKRTDTRLGVGGHFEFGNKVGVFVRGGYLRSDLSESFFINSTSDQGYFAAVGIRGQVHDRIELFATVNHHAGLKYTADAGSNSLNDYQFGTRIKLTKQFNLGVVYRDGEFVGRAIENGIDFDGFGLSGRYTF